ncbi:MAG: helicase-related protein [Candidatus Bathyarchaeota archaeon]|nr:helicase-related protein [Candidatus Bathyarchaeota archaeon]
MLQALKSGQIECRVYDRIKFHAKAYITHSKLEVIGSQALVGSSNFTATGLTTNIELNVQIQSAREVAQLQEWFEKHWNEASNISDAVIETISRHTHLYTPFDVYAKALQEFFRGHELTATEWDETQSKMYPKLDRYQKEAYWSMMKIARQYGGAFLCDAVGLGKTFVGLMLIERLILHEGKRVVLFAPKATREAVWEPHLKAWLSHCGGGDTDFSNLAVFSHTDLGRKGSFPERFQRIAELADVVIIDEAHHFRNPGRMSEEDEERVSRYYQLFRLLNNKARKKTLFMLTATPINNSLSDFKHMLELFTNHDERFFARTLGINNLSGHFMSMERALQRTVGREVVDVGDEIDEAQKILARDQLFRQLVVQRSRAYVKESQIRETGKATAFPERQPPRVADYSIRKTYSKLLDMFETAFTRQNPLFTLPMYYPLFWYIGKDKSIDPLEEGRQKQVVGLIRTNFLKRFESSVVAFAFSLERLMQKLLAFLEVHSETEAEKGRLWRWKAQNKEILDFEVQRRLDYWTGDEEPEDEEDIVPQEILAKVVKLDPSEYNVSEMMQETYLDLNQIADFLQELEKFMPKHDDKLQRLIRLVKSKDIAGQKVLIFTEFADTARYLHKELDEAGIQFVEEVDSARSLDRADVIKRFSPYYNGTTSQEISEAGDKEIQVLISTDVLSEGLNLQDATLMINYDIHWNPVRLMQRIGRVDRRLNPEIEKMIITNHPERAATRGKVIFWNFLPPDELNAILSLYKIVTQKTLLISKVLGIEGKKLLTPQDDYDALKEFNVAYEGTKTAIEQMHLEYQALIQENPKLHVYLKSLPGATFSGRKLATKGCLGVFFCYALPALDPEAGEFTEEAGTTRWYLYDFERDNIFEEPSEIIDSIKSNSDTPRICTTEEKTLIEIRAKLEKHIKNTYLKRVDAPVGVKPKLKCWMELNDG